MQALDVHSSENLVGIAVVRILFLLYLCNLRLFVFVASRNCISLLFLSGTRKPPSGWFAYGKPNFQLVAAFQPSFTVKEKGTFWERLAAFVTLKGY